MSSLGRIVEIAEDARYLSLFRGFLVVEQSGAERAEIGRVALDDIAAVIANAHGLSYSNNVLVALAERGIPFVLCGANHNPVGFVWSVDGNWQQAKRFDAQLRAGKPLQKQLWAEIVRTKLLQQSAVLQAGLKNAMPLEVMIKRVRSGDPDNFEAQGARYYWTSLFGPDFRRDQNAKGLNALLNYGYTVLRAATARAVIAAGLHPTLGIHHSNEGNPMRLVDDLMEPFRPVIDWQVWQLSRAGVTEVDAQSKRTLVMSLYQDLPGARGVSPVQVWCQHVAVSLAKVYLGETNKLELPMAMLALTSFPNASN